MSNAADRDSVDRQLASVSDALAIPASTVQITRVRLNQLGSEIDDQSMAVVGATTLALSAREDGLPITVADIAEAWSAAWDEGSIDPGSMTALFEDIAASLDMDGTPSEPRALIERFGAEMELPDGIVVVAKRILEDAFETDPQTIAGGTSPAGTAGAVLYLAADVNGIDGVGEDELGDVSETSQVTVRNRYKSIRELLGEDHLESAERYKLDPDTGAPMSGSSAPASADGGDAEAVPPSEGEPETTTRPDSESEADEQAAASESTTDEASDGVLDTVQSLFPDELPTTDQVAEALGVDEEGVQEQLEELADAGEIERKRAGTTVVWLPGDRESLSPDLTEDAVQNEVDALSEALDISASVRLFARGLVSDAVEDVPVENAGELAGAALLAACRINDVDVDATDIAAAGEVPARTLYEWLDTLSNAVDVEIPTLSADVYVDRLVETLDLDESVREESLRALEQYQPRPDDPEYTAPELAAGAMVFAATVGGAAVDPENLSEVSGADPEFISDAMNSILVSLCLGLVRGDIDYDETRWTSDLLESELSPDFGDSETGKAIALAKTYTAGRESQTVDDATIDVLVGE
jgi:transcription initiation factor TFIIIB Brf1 subunit/transcription initiation factor TFIIB